jgi:sugar phosphate isomerase/epimerase
MLSRRSLLAAPLALLAVPRLPAHQATAGRMQLCLHTNTSSGAGYRAALEGWARAGIRHVELNASHVDEFLKTDTLDAARRVLADNGLTPVHAAVSVNGLLDSDPNDAAVENLKKRLEMLAFLGLKRVYTTTNSAQKPRPQIYELVTKNLRTLGETAKAFEMTMNIEFVRSSPYMATLPTALKITRQVAHPNLGLMFDFYHFWSGPNRLEDMDEIRPGEIQHVHFQDVPDMPREMLDNNTRIVPGDGVAPVVATLKKLQEKGYAGPLSVELFLPEFRDGNPYEVAAQIRRKCEAVMRRAGVL